MSEYSNREVPIQDYVPVVNGLNHERIHPFDLMQFLDLLMENFNVVVVIGALLVAMLAHLSYYCLLYY